MKNVFFLIAFLCAACTSNTRETIIVFDTNKSYPQKEISVQDFSDITYVSLDDSILVTGRPRFITNSYIIYANPTGEIILFDRQGHFVRMFCHKGSGPGEYPYIGNLLYDPYLDQLLIRYNNVILYYTMSGDFIRSVSVDPQYYLWDLKNYNEEYLLCNNTLSLSSAYVFVSKETGEVKDSIDLGLKANVEPFISIEKDGMNFRYSAQYYNQVNSLDGVLLSHISSDTFYCFNEKKNVKPVFIRTPSIHEQTVPVFVNAWVKTSRYYFLSTVEKKYDPETDEGFAPVYYMIEKENRQIYTSRILNKDIEGSTIDLDPRVLERTMNARTGIIALTAEELLEENEKGKIKSQRLIDLVNKLEKDSNPVIMLMDFK